MANIIDRYTKITGINTYIVPTFDSYQLNPTTDDYISGVIYRYFVRKRNDENAVIFEINETTADKLKNDALYVTIGIRWKISGSLEEVKSVNKKSADIGAKTISNLHNYIKNYSKFWKG